MNRKLEIDLIPFLVESIICNNKIKKDIDSLYEENKYKAYQLAKNSKYYSHPMLCDGSIGREVYAKRALGLILLANEEDEIYNKLIKIFKKGWKALYKYINSNKTIDMAKLIKKFFSINYNDDEINGYSVITIFFATIMDKEIIPKEFMEKFAQILYTRLKHYEDGESRFGYDSLINNQPLLKKANSIKNRFFETCGEIKGIDDLWDMKNEHLKDYSDKISLIFDSENMMLSSMTGNIKINEKDIIELSALYYIFYKNQNKEQSAKFIIWGLYLKYLIKSYKEVKQYFFKNNKENLFIELEGLENNIKLLQSENKSLNSKIKVLEKELNRLRSDYKESIEKENILLKQDINKLKLQIEDMGKDKKELMALRKALFEEKVEQNNHSENIDFTIPNIKAIIAGGHNSWHDRLKEVLPNTFKYIEGNNETFDTNILESAEYIFIYTKHMSHAFYYRLMSKCRNIKARIMYINSTSPEYVKNEIKKALSSIYDDKDILYKKTEERSMC